MENLQDESGLSQEGVFPCDFEIYDRRTGNVTIADYVTRVEAMQGWMKMQLHNPLENTRDGTCRDKIELHVLSIEVAASSLMPSLGLAPLSPQLLYHHSSTHQHLKLSAQ